ncbi:MAG: MBL fold metallo-hydrolase [Pseudomonadota bacterium]
MRITLLGCGTSSGVPRLAYGWGACDPLEPRNQRMRSSVLIHHNTKNILIDTTPDFRTQALIHQIKKIDAVIYTHSHGDHIHGIDDIRSFANKQKQAIPAYMDQATWEDLKNRFCYVFEDLSNGAYPPIMKAHIVKPSSINIASSNVQLFKQHHGQITSLGIRIGDFAYSTDVSQLDDTAFECLEGIDVWVLDALQLAPHPTHTHLEQSLKWIDRVKPKHAILTHMNNGMDYQTLKNILPSNVEPGYDGMVISL